jgi:psp operon transcriptional activator
MLRLAELPNKWYILPIMDEGSIKNYIGESEIFLDFLNRLSDAAKVDRSVLVIGERGSGKEIAAGRLHYLSSRWQNPLVTVNCAALPQSLIESELFGYEAGAFTGAQKLRKGRFEEAEGGTIFLDEIGLIPLEVQEKILRMVEYGTYERVGSSKTHESNVRIIGATNSDLPNLCKEGKFKQDLLDRLSFEVIFVPPLRDRGDDILLLANYFAAKMAIECHLEFTPYFSQEAIEIMNSYSWPGNVRELKNAVERAVYRSKQPEIRTLQLDPFLNPFNATPPVSKEVQAATKAIPAAPTLESLLATVPLSDLDELKNRTEVLLLNRAMKEAGGNQKEAAKLMGLSYDQIRGLIRKHSKKTAM